MPLGTEVGLGPGDIMLDGEPASSPMERGTAAPIFQPTLLWHGRPSLISANGELLLAFINVMA